MAAFFRTTSRFTAFVLIAVAATGLSIASEPQTKTDSAQKKKKDESTIPGPGLSPAESRQKGLDVFQAAKEKKVEAKLVQQSERGGFLLLRNVTGEQLNVRFPDAFVGVNVIGNGTAQQVGGRGTAQSTGIAVTSGQSSRVARNEETPDVFAIPAGETIRLPITSVCLEYGKPTPTPKLRYVIMPVEQFSNNPVFHKLLPLFTKTKISQRVAQAAAWHVSNKLSWTELSSILNPRSSIPVPLFTANDLRLARALVEKATLESAQKDELASPESAVAPKSEKNPGSRGL